MNHDWLPSFTLTLLSAPSNLKCHPVAPAGRWCPEENAGIFSRLFFSYVDGILRIGKRKPLELPDLWDLLKSDEAAVVSQRFQDCLAASADDLKAPQGKVWKGVWDAHGKYFALAGLLKLVHDTVMFAGVCR